MNAKNLTQQQTVEDRNIETAKETTMKRFSVIWAVLAMVLLCVVNGWAQGPISGFYYPVDDMVDNWGYYANRSFYYDNNHLGADIDLAEGVAIKAIARGKIVGYSSASGYGELVVAIEHELPEDITFVNANGGLQTTRYILSIYGHLRKSEERGGVQLTWSYGQTVQQGDVIGYINDDAHNGDGLEHLHLGIRLSDELTAKAQDGGAWLRGYNNGSGMQVHFADAIPLISGLSQFAQSPSWHTGGLSQAFQNKYNTLANSGHFLGDPWDNGGSTYIHDLDGMWLQDFQDRRDSGGSSNGYFHPYTAIAYFDDPWMSREPHLLKEGFWSEYMNTANSSCVAGWEVYGVPISDEYLVGNVWWQEFKRFGPNYASNPNDFQAFYFTWNTSTQLLDVLDQNFQSVSLASCTIDGGANLSSSRTNGPNGVYHSGIHVADFNQSFNLVDQQDYHGFYAVVDQTVIPIDDFYMDGNMTIYVDPVVSQVIDLTVLPSLPYPGQTFQVWLTMSESPGVTVSSLRVVLQNMSGTVLQTIHSVNNYDLSWGFDGVYTGQYSTAGSYRVGVQYSMDNGSTWQYFDHDGENSNPRNLDIYSVPVANFSRTPSSGTAPLTVHFTDQSSNNPTSWSWSFGDGTYSTSQNPPDHVYTVAGTYNVSLTVTNPAGQNTRTRSVTVNPANTNPVANFTANTTMGVAPLSVHFTDLSTGNPDAWVWDFGDGATSSLQSPDHIYTVANNYTVSLLVSNQYHANQLVRTNYIHVGAVPLEANFTANVTSGVAPLTVQFTDVSTGNPTSWAWDLDGDNITDSNLQNPQFTYDDAGVYDVYLTVSNGTDQSTAYIYDYITVIFADCNANNIDDNLELTATVSAEQTLITSLPDVHDVQAADLDNDQDMDLVAVSSNGAGLRWYENVGGPYQEHVLLDDINDPTVLAFKIVDLNNDGLLDIVSGCNAHVGWHQNLDGRHFNLRVDSADDGGVMASLPIAVDALDIDGDGDLDIVSIVDAMDHAAYWYENDGSGNFVTRQTVYTGTYRGLTHGDIDNDGVENVVLWTNSSIRWYEKMESEGYIYFTSHTVVSSAGPGWIFSQIQVVDLDGDGDLDVCAAEETSDQLLCYFNNGSQSFSASSLASVVNPHRLAVNDVDGDGDRDLVASTDDSIICYLNDGVESFSQSNLTATFAGATSLALADVGNNGTLGYLLSASTTNTASWFTLNIPDRNHNSDLDECESLADCNSNGLGDQFEINMGTALDLDLDTVPDECQHTLSADFVAYNLSGYPPLTVDFSDRSAGLATTWSWSFGDGQSSALRHPQHIYETAGVYTVSLTVTDGQSATDTKVRNDYISVTAIPPLTADFVADTTTGMAPLTVQFTDQSTGAPLSWEWSFGDGNISTEQNPEHVYQQSGIFTVVLQVSDGLITRYKVRQGYIMADSDCNNNSVPDMSEMAPYAEPHVVSATAGETSFVYPVDLDFDGDVDMVSVTYGAYGAVTWHQNLGNQTYTDHIVGTLDRPRFVYVLDLDNDGDLDILSHDTNSTYAIYWYENVNFSFTEHSIPSHAVHNIYPCDLDQDGDIDILSPNGASSSGVSWYENQGNGVFVEQNINSRWVRTVYPSDVDADGDIDILAIYYDYVSGLYMYENLGQGVFSEHLITDIVDLAGSMYVGVADVFDNDEYQDIIFTSYNRMWLIENNDGDIFSAVYDITNGAAWYMHPTDIDGDGDQDFLSADMYGNTVFWYENENASFTGHAIVSVAYQAASAYPADIDGDGDLDVVVGAKGEQSVLWYDIVVPDRNHNNILDECEIANSTLADCNANGVPDFAEINMGTASDINDNGVPDDCESFEAFVELNIAYVDEEIVLDWNDISGASSYRVYGSCNGGSYSLVASRTVSHYTITGSMLDPGNTWLFYVTVVR